MTEQIQVARIDVVRIGKSVAGLSRSGPTVFYARQPAIIESNRALRQFTRPKHPRVPEAKDNKYGKRSDQPPRGKIVRSERTPGQNRSGYRQQKPRIPQLYVDSFEAGNPRLAISSSASVFIGRKHRLKM